ncbi:MAG: META domain-containing protein [Alphaproteobacteria bacterium]|nr:META domain-containing protein [Alphaproteobacteria bacterium]
MTCSTTELQRHNNIIHGNHASGNIQKDFIKIKYCFTFYENIFKLFIKSSIIWEKCLLLLLKIGNFSYNVKILRCKMIKFIRCLVLFVMISACSAQNNDFMGKEYKLSDVKNDAKITLGFDIKENRFYGDSAVNRYFGTYNVSEDNFVFDSVGSTMMAGPQDMMEIEQQYLQNLAKVKKFKVEENKLFLIFENGEQLIFEEISK